eukprot:TRINITY_DN1636_c0_g1_i1.p1 TRINITY_DN1636_c0_g1~~TRINITY_DN1636_c0_g1_i1.p1  ORF type:complete len:334 (-),score=34.01 TRINITY_DN1636_c0_g1_i1:93-1094(-)
MSAATGFEGVEKKLEVSFSFINEDADPRGLRQVPKEKWSEMLSVIKCTIISEMHNEYLNSYVLSESSLFVYPTKLIIKTCGTTRTLLCLDYLLSISRSCSLNVDFVSFSRKNFRNPELQHYPHTSFDQEIDYLNQYFDGEGYILGSTSSDHWNLYIYDPNKRQSRLSGRESSEVDGTLEVMMTDLDPEAMKQFYRDSDNLKPDKEVTKNTGIMDILPGAITDEFMFTPCGYSVNGLLDQSYFTIHVTPEPHCSFVSFETNAHVPSYEKLVNYVIDIFKPGNFQVALFIDRESCAGPSSMVCSPGRGLEGFRMKRKSYYEFDSYDVTVCNYSKT